MRKFIFLIMLLFSTVIFTGCVSGNVHYTINDDGSGDVSIRLAMNSMLAGLAGDGEDPFKEMINEAKADGFQVSRFNENDLSGIESKKHYEDFRKMFEDNNFLKKKLDTNRDEVIIEKGFFTDNYKLRTDLDMTEMTKGANDEISRSLINQIRFDFMLTLPTKAKNHNASKVSDDGRTYTWNLAAGQHNEIILDAQKPNIMNIAILVLAIVAILVFIVISKKRKINDSNN